LEALVASFRQSGANIWGIAYKELRTYFSSPMAYVVAAAFLAITGFFFVASVSDAFSEASIRGFSAGAIFFMIFLSPALTMRLLAEEQKLGTLELLLTSPVRETEIVIGKFIASFLMLVIMLALTLYYVLVLFIFGIPDTGPLYTGYMGMILYGAATLAVGLAASAITSNQLVALVLGAGTLTALTVVDIVAERLSGRAEEVLNGFQLGSSFQTFDVSNFAVAQGGHFADFSRGIINFGDILYYLGITGVFLFVAVVLLQSKRWR
jgi:ABC-2 type transport system permease protein